MQIEKGIQIQPFLILRREVQMELPQDTTLRKVISDPNPDYTATLTNEVAYKKFRFHLQLECSTRSRCFQCRFQEQDKGSEMLGGNNKKIWEDTPCIYSW